MVDSARVIFSEPDADKLRDLIRDIAGVYPRFPDFVARLSEQHVELQCNLTRSGRVSSISYVYASNLQYKASALGEEFTWTGLQRKLGIEYVKIRDFQLLTSFAVPAEKNPNKAKMAAAIDDKALLNRLDQVEALEKQILAQISHDELQRVDEAVQKLEEIASAFSESAPHNDESRAQTASQAPQRLNEELHYSLGQIRGICQRALAESNKSIQRVDMAASKMRQESFWLALVAALIVGLVSSLITGLWVSRETEKRLEANQKALIQQLEKNAENDPLRAYFQKLMDKMP
jgi:hypothetical protein